MMGSKGHVKTIGKKKTIAALRKAQGIAPAEKPAKRSRKKRSDVPVEEKLKATERRFPSKKKKE